MSKYTTQVRFICENKSGLETSGGFGDVDTIISKSWDKIFTTNVSIFDDTYKSVICQKILKHYYLREICSETVGVWLLWMNTRLEEIMPYYNQLYLSAKLEFNPFNDVDLTRKHTTTGNEKSTGDRATTSEGSQNDDLKELYSDTPQGSVSNLEDESYLTHATINKNNSTSNSTATENTNSNVDTTEEYIETIKGKQGSENYSTLLNKYRETLLNIDMQVIEEFSDLFFGLW